MPTSDCGAMITMEPESTDQTTQVPESAPTGLNPTPIVVPVSNANMHIINSLVKRLTAARVDIKRYRRTIRRLEAGERRVLCTRCGSWAWRTAEGTPPPDWGYAGQLISGDDAYTCPECLNPKAVA